MNKKIIKLIAAVLILVGGTSAQQAEKVGVTKQITFTKNNPCVVVKGSVQPKNSDTYVFHASKNQIIVAHPFYYGKSLRAPGNEPGVSGFVFVAPGGKASPDPQDIIFEAVRTGEYKILVRPAFRRTTGKYVLKISVTDEMPTITENFPNPPTCH